MEQDNSVLDRPEPVIPPEKPNPFGFIDPRSSYIPAPLQAAQTGVRQLATGTEERHRATFDAMHRHLFFSHVDPAMEEEEEGKHFIPPQKMADYLSAEKEKLMLSDPLISLLIFLAEHPQGKWLVGTHKISWPSVKSLNDKYLAYYGTNDFIAELNAIIAEKFREFTGMILRTDFKGGKFIIAATDLEETNQQLPAIKKCVNDALLAALKKRKTAIGENFERALAHQQYKKPEDEASAKNKLALAIQYIEELESTLRERPVEIVFGVAPLQDDQWMAIRNSECAANMALADDNLSETIRVYNEGHSIEMLIQGFQLLAEELRKPEATAEWSEFIMIDKDTHQYVLTEKALMAVRKKDDYLTSPDFTRLETSAQEKILRKLDILERFYRLINVIDILKNFTADHYTRYKERIEGIVTLCRDATVAIEESNDQRIRELFLQVENELRVSLKDEGQGFRQTEKAFVEALRNPRNKIMIFIDHIGFAVRNVNGYIGDAYRQIDLYLQHLEAQKSTEGLSEDISERIRSTRIALDEATRAIGDSATRHLRETEDLLRAELPGISIINVDGGDETNIVLVYDDQRVNIEEIIAKLEEIALSKNLRIAYRLEADTVEDLSDVIFDSTIHRRTRTVMARIMSTMLSAEETHAALKKEEADGSPAAMIREIE